MHRHEWVNENEELARKFMRYSQQRRKIRDKKKQLQTETTD